MREADQLDAGDPARPPLLGALLLVKDVFSVRGMETRCGSALPPELFDWPQASAVGRLVEAGCLVLGKSVTAELACLDPGPTRNPLDRARTPGGSSSGSAAGVAAGYAPLALGTQTVGSIVRPAAFCGIAAYKPTHGRVPADGVLPYAPSVDCVGLLGRDLEWLARGAASLVPGWTPAPVPERPPRLLVPDGALLDLVEPRARGAFERSLGELSQRGAQVRRVSAFEDWDDLVARNLDLTNGEMARAHARWFDAWSSLLRPTALTAVMKGRLVSDVRLDECRAGITRQRAALEGALDEGEFDAWVAPAAPGPAPADPLSTGSPAVNMPWTYAGMPVVAVPTEARVDGMPVGLQFAGRAGADEAVFALASRAQGT